LVKGRRVRMGRWLFLVCLTVTGCKSCEARDREEEMEERERELDHFWRARIVIVGSGQVKTFIHAFDCSSDGGIQDGACGPLLVRFKELAPATMEARPSVGWTFDHWESIIVEPDGATRPRAGRMPDGRVYLNGFGYADTGELEIVTAVFVPHD
jgi:hypothetical protein